MKAGDMVVLPRGTLAQVLHVPRDLAEPLQVMDECLRQQKVSIGDVAPAPYPHKAERVKRRIADYLAAPQRPRVTVLEMVAGEKRATPRPPSVGPVGKPDSSPGSPDHAQEPMVLAVGFTSDPTPLLMRYCSGPSEHERMLRALRRRHPRYYEILSANMQGEKLTAIAGRLGISPGNAREIKRRAMRWCREYTFVHTYQREKSA